MSKPRFRAGASIQQVDRLAGLTGARVTWARSEETSKSVPVHWAERKKCERHEVSLFLSLSLRHRVSQSNTSLAHSIVHVMATESERGGGGRGGGGVEKEGRKEEMKASAPLVSVCACDITCAQLCSPFDTTTRVHESVQEEYSRFTVTVITRLSFSVNKNNSLVSVTHSDKATL